MRLALPPNPGPPPGVSGIDAVLEVRLHGLLRRWRWLRLLGALAALGTAFSLAILAIGVAQWRHWLESPMWVILAYLGVLLGTGFAACVVLAATLVARRPWSFFAQALERVHPRLLDRLNTVVAFQAGSTDEVLRAYLARVQGQARGAMADGDVPVPFPASGARRRWAVMAATAAGTIIFYAVVHPGADVHFAEAFESTAPSAAMEPSLKLPEAESAEMKSPWGEVRITEPGRDLKVTKVDVVPLQIEAAANEDLAQARWLTAVGGAKGLEHALPAPREPHYAVYKPMLYVDEFRLSDWDVLTYYASASTRKGASYASDIYFLEVRPFREDILKLPGGENGKAYQFLNELSGLIDRQKHVMRETHGYLGRPYPKPEQKTQDRAKLVEGEDDLRQAARHLYGEIASKLENQDVGAVLDGLARASESLAEAVRALRSDSPDAPPREQDALGALVATRKHLQKAINDHPGAFGDDAGKADDEQTPVADLPDKLKQISEFRDEEKAARQFLDAAAAEQRKVAEKARAAEGDARKDLARQEEKLAKSLDEFASTHPRMFKGAEAQKSAADKELAEAAAALQEPGKEPGAQQAAEAARALEGLGKAVGRRTDDRQLAHAYRLKTLLDGHVQELSELEKSPDKPDPKSLARTAGEAKETTRALEDVLDQPAVEDVFDPGMKAELTPSRREDRQGKLDRLAGAQGAAERKGAAAAARDALRRLSEVFEKSQPQAMKSARKEDALGEGADGALERGLRLLESLTAPEASARRLSPEDDAKRRRETTAELRHGLESRYGKNERTSALLLELEKELKGDLKVNLPALKKLLEQIEQFRVEMGEERLAGRGEPNLRHVDLSHLPAAYRERIQRYFQKLSEQ